MAGNSITLIISNNDIEAEAICQLALSRELNVIDLGLGWGPGAVPSWVRIDDLASTVIIVETPDLDFEEAVRRSGRILRIVDHHIYFTADGRTIDRSSTLSSLEQVKAIFGLGEESEDDFVALGDDRFEHSEVAANDSGYWPGLMSRMLERGAGENLVEGRWRFSGNNSSAALSIFETVSQCLYRALRLRLLEIRKTSGLLASTPSTFEAVDELIRESGVVETSLVTRTGGGVDSRSLHLIGIPKRSASAPIADWIYLREFLKRLGSLRDPASSIYVDFNRACAAFELDIARFCSPLDILLVTVDSDDVITSCDGKPVADATVRSVFFSGGKNRSETLRDMLALGERGGELNGLGFYAGGGREAVFLGASGGEDKACLMSLFADRLIENIIPGARPVTQWRSQFFQTLSGRADELGLSESRTERTCPAPKVRRMVYSAQDRAYFLDHLRTRLLGPTAKGETAQESGAAVDAGRRAPKTKNVSAQLPDGWTEAPALPRSCELDWFSYEIGPLPDEEEKASSGKKCDAPAWLEVAWGRVADGEDPEQSFVSRRVLKARVEAIRVHFAFNGIVIVELQVGGKPWDGFDDGRALWRQLLMRQPVPPGEIGTLADLMDFNEAARTCYSPYRTGFESDGTSPRKRVRLIGEANAPLGRGTLIGEEPQGDTETIPSGWFHELTRFALSPWHIAPVAFGLVHDERARVVTTGLAAGRPPAGKSGRERHEVILARYAGIDGFEEHYLYDARLSREELARQSYSRYDGKGSYYATSGHSLTLLSYDAMGRTYLIGHMTRLYSRLFLTALHYSAVLLTMSHEVGRVAAERLHADTVSNEFERARRLNALDDQVHDVRARLTAFANGVWYEHLSPQLQGQELFALIVQHMPIRSHYAELTGEIERFDALVEADRRVRDDARFKVFTRIGVMAGAWATLTGVALAAHQFSEMPERMRDGAAALYLILFGLIAFALTLALVRVQDDRSWASALKHLVTAPIRSVFARRPKAKGANRPSE